MSRRHGRRYLSGDATDGGLSIPVVVMTGSSTGLGRVGSSAPAADAYVEKQTDPERYIDVLRSCFSAT